MPSTLEKRSATGQPKPGTISPLAGKPAPKEMLIDVLAWSGNILRAVPMCRIATSWSASAPAGTAARR